MQWWKDAKAWTGTKLARFNNRTFKDASMATCALIAAADGKVDDSERAKVVALIKASPMLQVFDAAALGQMFLGYCDAAGDEFARLNLLNTVRGLKSDAAGADTCLKIALIIANADGDFSAPEQKVVRELCGVLGLPAADYLPAAATA